MASTAAVLNILVNASTGKAQAELTALDKRLKGTAAQGAATSGFMGGKFSKGMVAGAAGATAFAVAAGAAAKALYGVGEEMDAAYDKIRTGTGATGRELEKLKKDFKSVAGQVPDDMLSVGTAVADLNTRLGLTGRPLRVMAKNMLNLSRITETDLEANIKSVARSFVDWEVPIRKQTQSLNGLYRLSQRSGASVAEIADNMQKFGSPLRTLGFSIGEAASMFAQFERAGVNMQTMVPGLKLAIGNLADPTDELRVSLEGLGVAANNPRKGLRQIMDLLGNKSSLTAIQKMNLAMDVFGKRAGADMAEAIKQGRFNLDSFLKTFATGSDTISRSAQETNDASENFAIFWNKVKIAVAPAADAVYAAVSDISAALAKIPTDKLADGFDKTFRTLKAFATLPADPLGSVKDIIDVFAGNGKEMNRIQQASKARMDAARNLQRASIITADARGRAREATKAERIAEQNLENARKQFGPGSQQVLEAEFALHRAKRKTIRLTNEAKRAERLEGVARQVAAVKTRDQVVEEKARIGVLNRQIRTMNRRRNAEILNNGYTKKAQQIEAAMVEKIQARDRSQKRLNGVLGFAATRIGPKFAESLKNITTRTATMEKALGKLPPPIKTARESLGQLPPALRRFGSSATKEMGSARDDMNQLRGASGLLRRVYNRNIGRSLPEATGAGMERIRDLLRENIDAIQNTGIPQAKRGGGLVENVRQRFRKGGVPVAVSPGEMFKTPDGKSGIVPGRPEPRDSVLTSMPVGTKIFTWDGQAKLAAGASESEALRTQRPHFADGGIVKPTVTGGTERGAEVANKAVGKAHETAKARLKWIKENMVTDLDSVTRIAKRFGLSVSSGYRPGDDGFHGVNRARDYSNSSGPTPEMLAFAKYMYENHSGKLLELIYTPLGAAVDNYQKTGTYAEGDHYDHVHVAMRGGGLVKNPWFDKKTKKGNINGIWPSADLTKDPNAWYALPTLPPYVFGALAEAAGRHFNIDVPGRAMMQMIMHEGGTPEGGKPGSRGTDRGGTVGYGPWGITTTFNDELVKRFGGSYAAMNNPVLNAAAMAHIVRDQGLGAWYGDKYVTDPTANWRGSYQLKNALGGVGYSTALRSALRGKYEGDEAGSGPSPGEQKTSRRDARNKQVRDLIQKAFGAKSAKAKKGTMWQILDLYAKYGDFENRASKYGGVGPGMSEAAAFLNKAGKAASVTDPNRGAGQLYSLVKWLQDNVGLTGAKEPNKGMADRLARVKKAGSSRAVKRRQKITDKIAQYGTDFPWKKALNRNANTDEILDDLASILSREHQSEWSEFGSEYSPAELKKEQDVARKLFVARDNRYRMLMRAIPWAEKAQSFYEDKLKIAERNPSVPSYQRAGYRKGLSAVRELLNGSSGLREDLKTLIGAAGVAGMSAFGGTRGDAYSKWLELNGTKAGGPGSSGVGISDLLQIVEAAKYGVYDRMPQFHTGGVVPGVGERPAMVMGGEGIFTREQMAAMGAGNLTIDVNFRDERLKDLISFEIRKSDRAKDQKALAGVGR